MKPARRLTKGIAKHRVGLLVAATVFSGLIPGMLPAADPQYAAVVTNPFGLASTSHAAPCFVDIDGDGDKDLFVGRNDGFTRFFQNTGSSGSPAFAAASSNPFGLTDVGMYSTPDFVDIDGDGDQDAFIGNGVSGITRFFRNSGNSGSPTFAAASASPSGLSPVTTYVAPELTDIDGDGDFDAFIGELGGNSRFFRNTGNSGAPTFLSIGNNQFGMTRVGNHPSSYDYATPVFVDIDGDGDKDALIGTNNGGTLFFFRNSGNSASPTFAAASSNPFGMVASGGKAHPDFVDIDGDGDLDLFVGTTAGGLRFFQNTIPAPDLTPPLSSATITAVVTSSTAIAVDFASSDPGSGVLNTALWVKRPGDVAFSNSGLTPLTGTTGTFNYTAALGDGTYEFYTIATDNSTNVESAPGTADDSIVLDTAAPTSSLVVDSLLKVEGANTGTYSADDATGTGIATVNLYHRKQGTATWTNAGPVTAGTWSHTPLDGSGVYYYQTVAIDAAGNSEAAPVDGTNGDEFVNYNALANGPMPLEIATGTDLYVFPMETGLDVTISFTGVTVGGTAIVSRTEGDNNPLGHDPAELIDQYVTVSASGITFVDATVTVDYDEALLGLVTESAIDTAFGVDGSVVTPHPVTLNTTLNTMDFTTTEFSDWYFGLNTAEVDDWAILER